MSWLKVVGGALAGVGVVVALPLAGPVGAITAGGAAIAAAVGGAVGKGVSEEKEEVKQELKKERVKNKQVKKKLDKYNKFAGEAIALFAVGMAAAKADGNICSEEKEMIDIFCKGLAGEDLPSDILNAFNDIRKQQPNLSTAIEIVKQRVKNPDWSKYEELISMVIYADGIEHKKETAFLEAFKRKIAA